MLIGVGITTSAESATLALSEARTAEALGFDFVSASDHPVGGAPSFETTALLGWIAANTERIMVASRVFGVPFRRPAMLAKWAESLDRLCGGRVILGLGGGYSDEEIAAVGAPRSSPGAKVQGLADAVQIIREAWTGRPGSHHGEIYVVEDLRLSPPAARSIPIWLGTYGPRALAVTGQLADGWIPSLAFAGPTKIPAMLDAIQDAAAAANRPAHAVQAIYNVPVRIDARSRSNNDTIAGHPADVLEQLLTLRELGFSGFNLMPVDGTTIKAIGEDVLPALRRDLDLDFDLGGA